MVQPIRPSQFILTYGVGSILESPKGPRLIPSFNQWDINEGIFSASSTRLSNYRIEDRNAQAQLGGGEIFEIPTNSQLNVPPSQPLFRTIRFPSWALCQDHKILYQLHSDGRTDCPLCTNRHRDRQDEAIRFVRACPKGHMDDVDWHNAVHLDSPCSGDRYDWVEETGSDLKSVKIRCRTCGKEIRLLDVYYRTSLCSGRFPEENSHENCDENASVVLRSATSLRIPAIITSITIPPAALRIHTLLSQTAIGRGLLSLTNASDDPKNRLLEALKIISQSSGELDPTTIKEIEETPSEQVAQAIRDMLAPINESLSLEEVKRDEFHALREASEIGYPPQNALSPLFEVDHTSVIHIPHSSGITFRITPVKRLRVVLVQRGYRRPVRGSTYPDGTPIPLIERFHPYNGKRWYPGVSLHGEGLFIDLPEGNPRLNGERTARWYRKFRLSGNENLHPLFIWWHTLSHRLLKSLAIDSGYSSASIRERIFFSKSKPDEYSGGILLYSSQQGADGSLGGLIALGNMIDFPRILNAAQRNLYACSNDPLCSENYGEINGSACYACLFTSETSCEFRNMYLDRLLLSDQLMSS